SVPDGYSHSSASIRSNKLPSTTSWRLRIRWFWNPWRQPCKDRVDEGSDAARQTLTYSVGVGDCGSAANPRSISDQSQTAFRRESTALPFSSVVLRARVRRASRSKSATDRSLQCPDCRRARNYEGSKRF